MMTDALEDLDYIYQCVIDRTPAHDLLLVKFDKLRAALTQPKAVEHSPWVKIATVEELANFIRAIDGDNTMGAGELAEKIVEHEYYNFDCAPKADVEGLFQEFMNVLEGETNIPNLDANLAARTLANYLAAQGYIGGNGRILDGFSYEHINTPHAFLQWKGTDACFDFYCECGAHCHFDGYFAYNVKCPHCEQKWKMPFNLFPIKTDDTDLVQDLEADEDMLKAAPKKED